MLTPRIVAEICRQRLNEPDASNAAKFIFQIPQALKAAARKIAANPNLRDLLMTDKSAVTAAITVTADSNGFPVRSVDLKPLYLTNHIFREYLDCGQMFINANNYPLEKLAHAAHGSLPQYLSDFAYWYVQGDTLFIVNAGDEAATVSFAVPYYPSTLAELPESAEVESLLIDKIIELCNVGTDVAEDGEK